MTTCTSITRHDLLEPLRALMLPCLPASSLAALRGTCQAMLSFSDHHTGAAWLAAASSLLPKGCLDRLQRQPEAASIQAQLQAQALAERAIMRGGGHVIPKSQKVVDDPISRSFSKVQWSPCHCWIAFKTSKRKEDNLHVVPALEESALDNLIPVTLAGAIPGVCCNEFAWLLDPPGHLLISHDVGLDKSRLSKYSASSRQLIDRPLEAAALYQLDCALSPCKTLIITGAWQDSAAARTLWHVRRVQDFRLQGVINLLPNPSSVHTSHTMRDPWSHDSSWVAMSLSCLVGSKDQTLICAAASGKTQQVLAVGHVHACNWSPASNILAYVTVHEGLKLWHASTSNCISVPAAMGPDGLAVSWASDGKHLFFASWDIAGDTRGHTSHIVSAAGSITWTGGSDLHHCDAAWAGNDAVCLTLGGEAAGMVLVNVNGSAMRITHDLTTPIYTSSLSPCGRLIVVGSGHTDLHLTLVHYKVVACQHQVDIVGQVLPFQVDEEVWQLAWHPTSRLSLVYAIGDADGILRIIDGSTGTALHTWQSQSLFGSQAPFEQGSWPSPGLNGRLMVVCCVLYTGTLVAWGRLHLAAWALASSCT